MGENGKRVYDSADPRCIVPEEIGTVGEVYHDARERVSALAREGKAPSARDMATLTALRTLQNRAVRDGIVTNGADLVVERERREAEFRATNKPARELYAEMYPQVAELGQEMNSIFSILDGEAEQDKSVELAARMVAIVERQKNLPFGKQNVVINLGELQQRVEELKSEPIIQELGKKLREDPNVGELVRLLEEGSREKNYSEENRKLNVVTGLSVQIEKIYSKRVAAREQRLEAEKRGITVAEAYRVMKPDVDAVIRGKRNYQEAVSTLALSLALREVELRDGPDARLDMKALKARRDQLCTDPLVTVVSQSLNGPTRQREMEKTIVMAENREQAFAGYAEGIYKQALAEKQQRLEARQAGEAKNADPDANADAELGN